MVTDSRKVETGTVRVRREGLSGSVRITLISVGVLVGLTGVIIGSILYVQHMDRAKVEVARQEAEVVIQNPIDEWLLGGDSYVAYREASARGDQQAARLVYVNSGETNKAMKSSMCYDLFNAAVRSSIEDDIQYAAGCIEENGAGLEVLSGMSKGYELAGDAINAQKYKNRAEGLTVKPAVVVENPQEGDGRQ